MSATPIVKAGDVIAGKYRVERALGTGGMGYVVAARHLQLDQLVAMKFLQKEGPDSPVATTRFFREAQAASRLRSEHVAKTYDIGSLETGQPYIVMEYLDGRDLSMLTRERPTLPIAEACDYAMQVCEALAEAHAHGIVHRDIKLANLFVTRGPANTPLVKVLDFGISKSTLAGAYEAEVTNAASLLGSPRFMSPEQMRDPRAVDARTDIWSLGVVLYRLLSGQAPFEADALGPLIALVMHASPAPLPAIRAEIPATLDAVVARCLEKDPAKRFASVAALAAALVPFCAHPARARAAAERVAAIHALPPPASAPSTPSGRRTSTPPAKDSGTAAPWTRTAVTARGGRSASAVWGAVIVAAVALTGLGMKLGSGARIGAKLPAAETSLAGLPEERSSSAARPFEPLPRFIDVAPAPSARAPTGTAASEARAGKRAPPRPKAK